MRQPLKSLRLKSHVRQGIFGNLGPADFIFVWPMESEPRSARVAHRIQRVVEADMRSELLFDANAAAHAA